MLLPVLPMGAMVGSVLALVFSLLFDTAIAGIPSAALIVALVACGLLVLVATIGLIVLLCLSSDPGPNRYGPSHQQPPIAPYGPGGSDALSAHHPIHAFPQQPPGPSVYPHPTAAHMDPSRTASVQ